jgi:hypothetical protein
LKSKPIPLVLRKFLIKLPQYKRFNYTPRYYKGKEGDRNIYDFDSAIRRERETYSYNDFRANWDEARNNSRHRGNRVINNRLLLIVAVLILLFLFIIDFDLTIFQRR